MLKRIQMPEYLNTNVMRLRTIVAVHTSCWRSLWSHLVGAGYRYVVCSANIILRPLTFVFKFYDIYVMHLLL